MILAVLFLAAAPGSVPGQGPKPAKQDARLNVLFITADDMNYDSPGVCGCKIPGITPHIDQLAREGLRFTQAHVTVSVCQPSRSVLLTGRYPHHNGALGFQPIRNDVTTLTQILRQAGYTNGIFGKVAHLAPPSKFAWDVALDAAHLGNGRVPKRYYEHARDFFAKAKDAGKPFFLMANSHDPHRPFAGAEGDHSRARRVYTAQEIEVPPFLPDLPNVRKELAQYFTSVHRCDETVGEVLRALKESGLEQQTLVMFLSDNGMAFPFAKTNCYLASTKTPWIVRWPGKVRPGVVDDTHFISGIDFLPTILEAVGLPAAEGMDGRSFVPLLTGGRQEGRDHVVTVFYRTSGGKDYPMRALQDRRFGYIYNAWSDGRTVLHNESQDGLTFKAMREAARQDVRVNERVQLFLHRVPDELYDFQTDPGALKNLVDDPKYATERERLRAALLREMEAVKDPLLPDFKKHLGRGNR
jgi:N-sulfoglucosamine sulfohydrolase